MANVSITSANGKLHVVTPYNVSFVAGARKLAGSWDADKKLWVFDARDLDRVKALCMTLYGSDGVTDDTCTIRVTYAPGESADRGPLTIAGRVVAKAWGRDSGAKLGEGIVLLEGGFTSGGSMKNWDTRAKSTTGAIVLVRDFPRSEAERMAAECPEEVAIEPEGPVIDHAALTAEREKLVARLVQIDALLSKLALKQPAF